MERESVKRESVKRESVERESVERESVERGYDALTLHAPRSHALTLSLLRDLESQRQHRSTRRAELAGDARFRYPRARDASQAQR